MRSLSLAGLGMVAGVVLLGIYAAGEDDYYGDGTTHWGHATKDGGTAFLTALFVVPALIGCMFVILGFARRRTSELWLIPAFAAYGLFVWYAFLVLSLGH